MLGVLAAVLWLGEVQFESADEQPAAGGGGAAGGSSPRAGSGSPRVGSRASEGEKAALAETEALHAAARLLGCDTVGLGLRSQSQATSDELHVTSYKSRATRYNLHPRLRRGGARAARRPLDGADPCTATLAPRPTRSQTQSQACRSSSATGCASAASAPAWIGSRRTTRAARRETCETASRRRDLGTASASSRHHLRAASASSRHHLGAASASSRRHLGIISA